MRELEVKKYFIYSISDILKNYFVNFNNLTTQIFFSSWQLSAFLAFSSLPILDTKTLHDNVNCDIV